MSIKKCGTNEEGDFAMAPDAVLKGCACPKCAAEKNIHSDDEFLQSALSCLQILLEEGRIMVFDPATRMCLSDGDIDHVCTNGNSIQIGLSETWQKKGEEVKRNADLYFENKQKEAEKIKIKTELLLKNKKKK